MKRIQPRAADRVRNDDAMETFRCRLMTDRGAQEAEPLVVVALQGGPQVES